jgi:hypothetical protein
MPTTPNALGRRYAPFIAVAAVQVLLVAITPSKDGGRGNQVASGAPGDQFVSAGEPGDGGGPFDADADAGAVAGGPGASGTGSSGAGGTRTGPGGSTPSASSDGSGAAGAVASGPIDRSKCGPDGRQIGPTYYMPACAPVWKGGDNGGATMTGVDAETIRYVVYEAQSDPQIDAILATQGLAASEHDQCEAWAAFDIAINKRWEFYGRKMVALDGPGVNKGSTHTDCDNHYPHFKGACTLSPPDPPCVRAEAKIIAEQLKPAYVIAPVANVALVNELSKRGIMVAGGNAAQTPAPASYYADFAPYYWDAVYDGTLAMRFVAEYWCKKLAGQAPVHAGAEVRANVLKRKLGVIYPLDGGDTKSEISAKYLAQLVSGGLCGSSADAPRLYPYESDITKAQEQSQATAARIRNDKVSTVVCYCDPIAPVFMTTALDQQNWHPEHLLSGTGLIDYDVLARLYSPTQWLHAFGPSQLYQFPSIDQVDAAKAWRDAGRSGLPDQTENLVWTYFGLMATSFHYAGPRPTPEGIRDGLFRAAMRGGWAESRGNPQYPALKFGARPDDYTGIEDVREVFWSAGTRSRVDGKPGAYVGVDGSRRYLLGEIPAGPPKVFR